MKKNFKFFLVIFVVFMLTVVNFNVRANVEAKMIITSPGEDSSTEMNISYHVSSDAQTFVMYADNEFFSGVQIAHPQCSALPFEGKENYKKCEVNLQNLKPNTRYYYKVSGVTNDVVMSFKTAGGDEFTFAHVTDIHSYFFGGGSNTRVDKANKVLNKMNEIKELDFVLASGDVTAYGIVYEQWEYLFGMDVLKDNMFAVTPGNHDYYNTSAQFVSVDFFNAVTSNPNNGAEGVKGSSYYFKYGNALFVSLDSEAAALDATHRANQIEWLNEVTANNPADFIIVFTHRPFYTGDGQNAGQARDMKEYFQEIFDNTGVDLVLGGHNHVYARTYQVYQDEVISGKALGTYYITGIQIGDRYKEEPGTKQRQVEVAHLGADQDGGNLITVGKDKITVEFVKHDGTRLYPFVIHSKSALINKTEIESKLKVFKDKQNEEININFDIPSPGLIKKIEVLNDDTLLKEVLNPTQDKIILENAPEVGKYSLTINMSLRNGEVITKNFDVIDDRHYYGEISNIETVEKDFHTELVWDATPTSYVSHYEVYVNNELLKQIPKNQSSTILDQVSPYKANDISFRIINVFGIEMYRYDFVYGEDTAPVELEFIETEITLTVGDEKELEYTVKPNETVKLEYKSSNQDIAYVDENGNLIAVSEGEVEIEVNIAKRWDTKVTIKVIVEPVPEKKGCFKGGYIFAGLTALGFVFILRRRRP